VNTDPDFVGVQRLIESHKLQWEHFCEWADNHEWDRFHSNHYDWWAFPIDRPSSFGFMYTVFESEISQMKSDKGFMERHRDCARLLMLSWGWDAQNDTEIKRPSSSQKWAHWPIRLAKCSRSMWLFGQLDLWQSTSQYAEQLLSDGFSFWYNGRDLFGEIVSPEDF